MKVQIAAACTAASMLFACSATAAPVLSFDSARLGAAGQDLEWGWKFTTNQAISVTALDTYFIAAGGSTSVFLYDSSGTVLASATITASDTLVGGPFSYYTQAISATELDALQTYFIAMNAPTGTSSWADAGGVATDPSVTYGGTIIGFLGTSPQVDLSGGAYGSGFFGVNFEAAAVPEPSTVLLVIAAAFGLLASRRQRLGHTTL